MAYGGGAWSGKDTSDPWNHPNDRWSNVPQMFEFDWNNGSMLYDDDGRKAGIFKFVWADGMQPNTPERIVLCLIDDSFNNHYYEVMKDTITLDKPNLCLQLSAFDVYNDNNLCNINITTRQQYVHQLQYLYDQLIEATSNIHAVINPNDAAALSIQRIPWPT